MTKKRARRKQTEPPPRDLLLKQIGESVRRHRLKRNYSQQHLADRAKMGVRPLAYIEAGESDPKASTVVKLAAALGVSVKALLESAA